MEYEKLHPNSKKSWTIARVILLLIFGGIIFTFRFIVLSELISNSNGIVETIINVIMGIILIFLVLNAVVYPMFEYKQWKYVITKDKVEFSEGIFFVKKVIIPIIRIQHIQLSQGPINRKFGLATLIINTAGGAHRIPNIEYNRADEISELLKNKVKEKVEENV